MITENYVLEKLALVLGDLPQEIDCNQNLMEWGLDSIKMISLVVMLEEDLGKELDDDLLLFDRLNTVNKIKNALEAVCHELNEHA